MPINFDKLPDKKGINIDELPDKPQEIGLMDALIKRIIPESPVAYKTGNFIIPTMEGLQRGANILNTGSVALWSKVQEWKGEESAAQAALKDTELGRALLGDEPQPLTIGTQFGAMKIPGAVASFGLDVAGDPFNYVAGLFGVGKKIISKGLSKSGLKALGEMSEEAAMRVGKKLTGNKKAIGALMDEENRLLKIAKQTGEQADMLKYNKIRQTRLSATGELEDIDAMFKLDQTKVGKSKLLEDELVKKTVADQQDVISEMRKRPRSDAEVQLAAQNLEPEMAKKLTNYKRMNLLDDETYAASKLAEKELIDNIPNILNKVDKTTPLTDAFVATGSEAGGAFRIRGKAINEMRNNILDYIENSGKFSLDEQRLLKGNLIDKGLFKKGDVNPSLWKKFIEYSVSIKLSLSSAVKAVGGNSAMTIIRYPAKFGEGAIDAFIYGAKKAVGKEAKRVTYVREAFAGGYGTLRAFKDASKSFLKGLSEKTNVYSATASKATEVYGSRAAIGRGGVLAKPFDIALKKVSGGRFGFDLGEIIRSPIRPLKAVDNFFRQLNYNATIYEELTKKAIGDGYKNIELIKQVNKMAKSDIPVDIIVKAEADAGRRTFQQGIEDLKIAGTLDKLRQKAPVTKLIVPFWRTPVNILREGINFSPLGALKPLIYKDIATNPELLRKTLGEAFAGSATLSGMYLLALQGDISGGGPKSKTKRNMLRLTGWQPYSFKVGNMWISYNGFEPISGWMRTAADLADKGEAPTDEVAKKLTVSYMKQYLENPFLQGINELITAGDQLDRGTFPKVMGSIVVGSTLPNVIQQWVTRVYDPVVREPIGIYQKYISRLPGLSKEIKPMRTIFGEKVKRDLSWASGLGFNISIEKGSRLEKELAKISDIYSIGKPSKIINGHELSDKEYDRLLVIKGKALKDGFSMAINSDAWYQMDKESKARWLESINTKVTNSVKTQEFGNYYRGGQ